MPLSPRGHPGDPTQSQAQQAAAASSSSVFRFLPGDITDPGLRERLVDVSGGVPFDVLTCHFAFHYACGTADAAAEVLDTMATLTGPGSVVLITTVDYRALAHGVPSRPNVSGLGGDRLSFGNKEFAVTMNLSAAAQLRRYYSSVWVQGAEAAEASDGFGMEYSFSLGDAVQDCEEFVVPIPTIVRMAAERGLRLVAAQNFSHLVTESCQDEANRGLLSTMKVLPTDAERALSQHEWEINGMYASLIFAKA